MNPSPKAFVLMTAMPPTKGHLRLIEFAARLGGSAEVIVNTQPEEPYAFERVKALREVALRLSNSFDIQVNIHHIHKSLPQEPEGNEGFWDMWTEFLTMHGLQTYDFIVASEMYGAKLAEVTGATFMPYDVDREMFYSKATLVRREPLKYFDQILPEFQRNLIKTVTIFGAESTGKTTLSNRLRNSDLFKVHWMFEYARPYLEKCGTEITTESMTGIWHGQRALQEHAKTFYDRPFVMQDTDLFSTVGYWDFWDMNTPQELVEDAIRLKSDLYLITQSNIPFEEDPIRYGGDKRESDDQYWIDLCERYELNYRVIQSNNKFTRTAEAELAMLDEFESTFDLHYERVGNA